MERLDCLSSSLRLARPEYDGKRRYSLGRMDGGSRNICRAGRARHQQAIRFIPEMRMTVRIVYVLKLVLRTLLQNFASAQPGFLLRLEYPR